MKGCSTNTQLAQLVVLFGGRVKGVEIRDEFAGKASESGNWKLCFHPNDSRRFEFSLFNSWVRASVPRVIAGGQGYANESLAHS